ncbi:hypothetical protein GCM10022224_097600 [Nonomuraea antimicrobica]|uniref:Protein kinase domain-containing protein n=1 Tax=Nonomuraea antimicrobica TaxID=561173 RepID=A0ABP7EAA5_9ACTN
MAGAGCGVGPCPVAVKELRLPEHISEQDRRNLYARMEREARAAARLKHPGIVTVYNPRG